MDVTVVETHFPPKTYYRNQVQNKRGVWCDMAPKFSSLVEARVSAKIKSLEGYPVRVMKISFTEGVSK